MINQVNTLKSHMLPFAFAVIFNFPVQAASPDFQDFLFSACVNSSGALADRCIESDDGDLSGDSEDSLSPTQSLSYGASALADTRARIKALQAKLRQDRELQESSQSTDNDESVMRVFRISGASGLLQGESTHLDRSASQRERAYETDSHKLQFGIDYRVTDDWVVGAVLSIQEAETTFDGDGAGVNFDPGSSEGGSDADSQSLSLFTSKNFGDEMYIEGLISYGESEYTFNRIAIFQESTRDPLLNRAVKTSADTDGYQLALAAAMGIDKRMGDYNLSYYANLDYQKSSIDAYREQGGEGFGMAVSRVTSDQILATLGAKLSRSFNTDGGVWVPQLFFEVEQVLDEDTARSASRFLDDTAGTSFALVGDVLDQTRWRVGFSLLTVRPNGWMGFIGVSTTQGDDLLDQRSINAGLRVEF